MRLFVPVDFTGVSTDVPEGNLLPEMMILLDERTVTKVVGTVVTVLTVLLTKMASLR